jgi:hypothetical protein
VSRFAVFAYGSLVSRESAGLTLGRDAGEPVPAELPGWRRRWSTVRDNEKCEKTFARVEDGSLPSFVLGLNLERASEDEASERPNGALLELDEASLERLDLRELRYERTEVRVEAGTGFDAVYAYTAKPTSFAPEPPAGAVIIAAYLRAVEEAFAELGPGQLERFRESTGPPPVEVAEARLLSDEIPAGNPRNW